MAKYCVKCGKELSDNDRSCHNCGTKAAKVKPVRDAKQKKQLKKKAITLSSIIVVAIAAITVAVIAFINSTTTMSDIFPFLRGKTIMTVNGYKVPANEFRFFCALVLEDEELVYYYKDRTDFDDLIKDEAQKFVKEYICRLSEAKEAGFKLTAEEEKKLLEEIDGLYDEYSMGTQFKTEKEFYDFFYGISKKQFITFRRNWAIIDKYNIAQEENADTSEKIQKEAYDFYEDFLFAKKTMVVVRYITDLEGDKLEKEKQLVERLFNEIKDGDDMFAIVKGYGQDDDLVKSEGMVSITASFETSFPELYEWAKDAKKGDLDIIETKDAYYIVRCEDVIDYDKLKNTEDMIDWAKFYTVNKNIQDLMNSDKYKIKLNEKNYKKLDISDLTKETLDYFKQAWQSYYQ